MVFRFNSAGQAPPYKLLKVRVGDGVLAVLLEHLRLADRLGFDDISIAFEPAAFYLVFES